MIRDGIDLCTIQEARCGRHAPREATGPLHQQAATAAGAATNYILDGQQQDPLHQPAPPGGCTYSSVALVASCRPLIWHRTSFNRPQVESFEFYLSDATSSNAPLKFRCWGDLAVHVAARVEPGAVVLMDSYRLGTFGAGREQVGCWDRECTELHVLRSAHGGRSGRFMFDARRHDALARAVRRHVDPLLLPRSASASAAPQCREENRIARYCREGRGRDDINNNRSNINSKEAIKTAKGENGIDEGINTTSADSSTLLQPQQQPLPLPLPLPLPPVPRQMVRRLADLRRARALQADVAVAVDLGDALGTPGVPASRQMLCCDVAGRTVPLVFLSSEDCAALRSRLLQMVRSYRGGAVFAQWQQQQQRASSSGHHTASSSADASARPNAGSTNAGAFTAPASSPRVRCWMTVRSLVVRWNRADRTLGYLMVTSSSRFESFCFEISSSLMVPALPRGGDTDSSSSDDGGGGGVTKEAAGADVDVDPQEQSLSDVLSASVHTSWDVFCRAMRDPAQVAFYKDKLVTIRCCLEAVDLPPAFVVSGDAADLVQLRAARGGRGGAVKQAAAAAVAVAVAAASSSALCVSPPAPAHKKPRVDGTYPLRAASLSTPVRGAVTKKAVNVVAEYKPIALLIGCPGRSTSTHITSNSNSTGVRSDAHLDAALPLGPVSNNNSGIDPEEAWRNQISVVSTPHVTDDTEHHASSSSAGWHQDSPAPFSADDNDSIWPVPPRARVGGRRGNLHRSVSLCIVSSQSSVVTRAVGHASQASLQLLLYGPVPPSPHRLAAVEEGGAVGSRGSDQEDEDEEDESVSMNAGGGDDDAIEINHSECVDEDEILLDVVGRLQADAVGVTVPSQEVADYSPPPSSSSSSSSYLCAGPHEDELLGCGYATQPEAEDDGAGQPESQPPLIDDDDDEEEHGAVERTGGHEICTTSEVVEECDPPCEQHSIDEDFLLHGSGVVETLGENEEEEERGDEKHPFADDVYRVSAFDSAVASAVLGNIPAELIVASKLKQTSKSAQGDTFDFAGAVERVVAGLLQASGRHEEVDVSVRLVFDPRLLRELGCMRADVALVLVDLASPHL